MTLARVQSAGETFGLEVLRRATILLVWSARGMQWVCATKKRQFAFMVLFSTVAVVISHVARAHADALPTSCGPGQKGFVDQVSDDLSADMSGWPAVMLASVSPVFWTMLSFTTVLGMVLQIPRVSGDGKAIIVTFLSLLIVPIIATWLYLNGPGIATNVVSGLMSSASTMPVHGAVAPTFTSFDSIEPGDAFMKFQCVSDRIDQAINSQNADTSLLTKPIPTILLGIAAAVCEFFTSVAGMIVMIELLLLKCEGMFVISVGVVLLAGLGSPLLYGFPMRYLGALIGLGLKGLSLSVLSGIAIEKALVAVNAFSSSQMPPPHDLFVVALTLIALAALAWFVPNILATLGGAPAMSFASGIAAGMALQSAVSSGMGIFGKLFPSQRPPGNDNNNSGGGGNPSPAHEELPMDLVPA